MKRPQTLNSIKDYENVKWDGIIIGSGMAGGSLGLALSQAGLRILFVDKGPLLTKKTHHPLDSQYAEAFMGEDKPSLKSRLSTLKRAGRQTETLLNAQSFGPPTSFTPFLGQGGGGSSLLYGMAMERFRPSDFIPAIKHPGNHGANLPDQWPINYDQLSPYYNLAEQMFSVHGTRDPLGAINNTKLPEGPKFSPPNQELFNYLTSKGAHPYRLPMACQYKQPCFECQGFICPKNCKKDSLNTCITPALENYGAEFLEECEVTELISKKDAISAIKVQKAGQVATLMGDLIILAANAIYSPALLLKSKDQHGHKGLANKSGMVGKNLMRHCIDMYAINTMNRATPTTPLKEMGLGDYYDSQGQSLGTIQSFGHLPPPSVIKAEIIDGFTGLKSPLSFLLPLVWPFIRNHLNKNLYHRPILTTILEDLPYVQNHVNLGGPTGTTPVVNYRVQPYDHLRIKTFRKIMKNLLSDYSVKKIYQSHSNKRIAHMCGTCRMGESPENSVVNSNNKSHEFANLYIIDSSFFPTSAGLNPSMSLAANSLRVSKAITGVDFYLRSRQSPRNFAYVD